MEFCCSVTAVGWTKQVFFWSVSLALRDFSCSPQRECYSSCTRSRGNAAVPGAGGGEPVSLLSPSLSAG